MQEMTSLELTSVFDYAGWKIRYTLTGGSCTQNDAQAPIVFVHGTPWSSVVFKPIARALLAASSSRTVLLYDLPGYGESQEYTPSSDEQVNDSRFDGDTSVSFQANALSALLSNLQLDGQDGRKPPALVVHDIAGAIALRAHLIHNCDFSSLLLMDTNAVLPWGDGFYKLVRSQPEVFQQLPANIFEAVVRAVTKSASASPQKLKSGWEDALVRPWTTTRCERGDTGRFCAQTSFVRQIAQANDADLAEMLDRNMYSRVRCDVKILWGENDEWIPREKMERLGDLLGSRMREFVVVPQAGHLIMVDQPERVALEVSSWLGQVRSGLKA